MAYIKFTDEEMEAEKWLPILGFEGKYEVSTLGRVRSLDRYIAGTNGKPRPWKGRILAGTVGCNGYLRVSLGNRKNTVHIHRVVAETWIPNPEDKPHVNHINGNPQDARMSNLEWCTAAENEQHSYRSLGKR